MTDDVLFRRDTLLVRRLHLAPGEATPWHRDPYHRISVILAGESLLVEFSDGGAAETVQVVAGHVDWDEPCDRMHRAVNVGETAYEEVTVFLLDRADALPQPGAG